MPFSVGVATDGCSVGIEFMPFGPVAELGALTASVVPAAVVPVAELPPGLARFPALLA